MDTIKNELPSKDTLIRILQKTIEKSWKIDMIVDDIEEWLLNFTGKVFDKDLEQHLALWILCNFTYYNQEDIKHLCKVLFDNFCHQLLVDFSLSEEEEIERVFNSVNYSAIGRASESGNFLLYDFRQQANLNINKFHYPTNIQANSDKIIAFVDDVILSATTATEFLEDSFKSTEFKKVYYLTIFATDEAVKKLKEYNVDVIYCSLLEERNKCFSKESMIFSRYKDLLEPSQKLAESYGKKLFRSYPLGFKDGQYSFGFYYNTPNNSLPIFWSDKKGWKPIFKRKGKNNYDSKRPYRKYI